MQRVMTLFTGKEISFLPINVKQKKNQKNSADDDRCRPQTGSDQNPFATEKIVKQICRAESGEY